MLCPVVLWEFSNGHAKESSMEAICISDALSLGFDSLDSYSIN